MSGSYKLVEGEHLTNDDKYQILMHKDLAAKHGWKVGDKVKLNSNIYDADNEKGAKETVEVTIKGLFDGHNKSAVTYSQELYENTAITDIHTAAQLYGYTEDTAIYGDATFFVAGDKNLDTVMQELGSINGINWKLYSLIKSSSNYPALEQSISGMYKMANLLFWGSLGFSVLLLGLLLTLWINARRKEVGILLSIGLKQASILGQFITEAVMIAIPALISAYFLANHILLVLLEIQCLQMSHQMWLNRLVRQPKPLILVVVQKLTALARHFQVWIFLFNHQTLLSFLFLDWYW